MYVLKKFENGPYKPYIQPLQQYFKLKIIAIQGAIRLAIIDNKVNAA